MYVDPRGVRFAAWITVVVLSAYLVTGATWILALQFLAFAAGAVFGLRAAPYGLVFKALVRPRLASPAELEAEAPPRFAQTVGAVFAGVALVAVALGLPWVAYGAAAMALAAAFLNAAFDFCLGCEAYLMLRRMRGAPALRRMVQPPSRRAEPAPSASS